MMAMQLRSDPAKAEVAARFVGVMVNCPAIIGMYAVDSSRLCCFCCFVLLVVLLPFGGG